MRLPQRIAKPAYRAADALTLRRGGRPMTATWSGQVVFTRDR